MEGMEAPDSFLPSMVRERRIALRLSQSRLAELVEVSQSAISLFENGDVSALSAATISAICAELELPSPESLVGAGAAARFSPSSHTGTSGYCPNPHCLLNVEYRSHDRVYYRPTLIVYTRSYEAASCPLCGELLESRCVCGAGFLEGAAFCGSCGRPFVTPGTYSAAEFETRRADRDYLTAHPSLVHFSGGNRTDLRVGYSVSGNRSSAVSSRR